MDNSQITITDNAAFKIAEIIKDSEAEGQFIRTFVQGGGCSGFQYGFTFENEINDDDFVVEKNDIKLLVDSMSMTYLTGAKIDYKEDLTGSQFVIENPNAQSTCGCGSSFSA